MTSLICVDASFVLRMLVPAPYSPQALALFSLWHGKKTNLAAPALLPFEVTSVLRRLVFLKELSAKDGEAAFEAFCKIKIHFLMHPDLFSFAWKLAKELNQARAYDAAYLAAAQLQGAEFWTADERLFNGVKDRFAWIRWVGDYTEHR